MSYYIASSEVLLCFLLRFCLSTSFLKMILCFCVPVSPPPFDLFFGPNPPAKFCTAQYHLPWNFVSRSLHNSQCDPEYWILFSSTFHLKFIIIVFKWKIVNRSQQSFSTTKHQLIKHNTGGAGPTIRKSEVAVSGRICGGTKQWQSSGGQIFLCHTVCLAPQF